jgi:hypothetical protein
MKSVRFSQVVATSGRPEVFLLFDPDDADFKAALRQHRLMTVVEKRASAPTGLIGYEPSQHGQLLIFPKSLQPFAGTRVVGIKFDLLAEPSAAKHQAPPKTAQRKKKESTAPKQIAAAEKTQPAPVKPKREEERKVIAFPPPPEEDEDPHVEELKRLAREAMAALHQRRLKEAERVLTRLLKA